MVEGGQAYNTFLSQLAFTGVSEAPLGRSQSVLDDRALVAGPPEEVPVPRLLEAWNGFPVRICFQRRSLAIAERDEICLRNTVRALRSTHTSRATTGRRHPYEICLGDLVTIP